MHPNARPVLSKSRLMHVVLSACCYYVFVAHTLCYLHLRFVCYFVQILNDILRFIFINPYDLRDSKPNPKFVMGMRVGLFSNITSDSLPLVLFQ